MNSRRFTICGVTFKANLVRRSGWTYDPGDIIHSIELVNDNGNGHNATIVCYLLTKWYVGKSLQKLTTELEI